MEKLIYNSKYANELILDSLSKDSTSKDSTSNVTNLLLLFGYLNELSSEINENHIDFIYGRYLALTVEEMIEPMLKNKTIKEDIANELIKRSDKLLEVTNDLQDEMETLICRQTSINTSYVLTLMKDKSIDCIYELFEYMNKHLSLRHINTELFITVQNECDTVLELINDMVLNETIPFERGMETNISVTRFLEHTKDLDIYKVKQQLSPPLPSTGECLSVEEGKSLGKALKYSADMLLQLRNNNSGRKYLTDEDHHSLHGEK